MKTITASERTTLIRLASTLPVGDETRKALINGLRLADCYTSSDWKGNGTPGKLTCNNLYVDYGKHSPKTNTPAGKKEYNAKYDALKAKGHKDRSTCAGPLGDGAGHKCD
jgi:hypothetical protein